MRRSFSIKTGDNTTLLMCDIGFLHALSSAGTATYLTEEWDKAVKRHCAQPAHLWHRQYIINTTNKWFLQWLKMAEFFPLSLNDPAFPLRPWLSQCESWISCADEKLRNRFRYIQKVLLQRVVVVFLLVPNIFPLPLTGSSWDFQAFWSYLSPSHHSGRVRSWKTGIFQKHVWSLVSLVWIGRSSVPLSAAPPPPARPSLQREKNPGHQ